MDSKLFSVDSIFQVTFYDTLYKMELQSIDSRNAKWIRGKPFAHIVAVSIAGSSDVQFLKYPIKHLGLNSNIPSDVIEIKGKLFYWWENTNNILSEEKLQLLKKFNLLIEDSIDVDRVLSRVIDDRKKGKHYFFCRNEIYKYKKKKTNLAIGYYKPPKINCTTSK